MILYLDTSALVKKYFEEKNSFEVISAWKSALGIATSAVAYAELLAAVYRKAGGDARQKIVVSEHRGPVSRRRVQLHHRRG